MFSARTPSNLSRNALAQALGAVRARGGDVIDLTESNPTRCGFAYPDDFLAGLGDPRALTYTPCPFGSLEARSAVSGDYARRGLRVPPERIALTTSTSEAYGMLFKLLADAGDEVLVPRPSYPLFDHLTRLDLVRACPYDLESEGGWSIDFDSVERAFSPRTRAVLVVSPNNPTGSFVKPDEIDRLAGLCGERDAALIADEVFADYELEAGAAARAGQVLERRDVLAFSLGGLSKSVGLPQAKLAWVAAAGPEGLVPRALERLELICDTYLSVSTPVQAAAAGLLERGAAVRTQIARRVRANYAWLRSRSEAGAARALASEGGWYSVLQVPSLETEEAMAVRLLEQHGVLAHPGYFFDFSRESYLVVSLLATETAFAEGIDRILRHFDCTTSPGRSDSVGNGHD